MTKEEAIKEAWGSFYEIGKPDANGWVRMSTATNKEVRDHFLSNEDLYDSKVEELPDSYKTFFRLKTLSGIEDNNGWIKIESEADLPTDKSLHYDICRLKEGELFLSDKAIGYSNLMRHWYQGELLTHYKPTDKVIRPIY